MLPMSPFLEHGRKHNLFEAGQRVLVAVSGGRDSVLLAHFFHQAQFSFGVAHCNFQLRGEESQRDENFVRDLAARFNAPFYLTHFNTQEHASANGISTQMAARELRYAWFEHIRKENGYDAIAVAHHLQDVTETMLLNLVRGTGISGLHGILPKTGFIIRPLLYLTGDEISGLISDHEIDYVEDSSNASPDYARNKIRLEVLPLLRELNPSLDHTFGQNAKRFHQTEQVLRATVFSLQKELLKKDEAGFWLIPKAAFAALEPLELLAFELFRSFGFTEAVVHDLLRSLNAEPGRQFFSAQYRLTIDRQELIIESLDTHDWQPVRISESDIEISYAHFTLKKTESDPVTSSKLKLCVDPQKLIFPLTIRPWQTGDYFYPVGMKGRKKLSNELTDRKIPLAKKARIPLLVNGDGAVIWICGIRSDRRFQPGAHTGKVVIFELCEHSL